MRDKPVFVLMAGLPGTGKTSLAAALGEKLGWPVIGKDFLKTSLLTMELGWSEDLIGRVAYDLLFDLARDFHLCQGFSLIFDTSAHRDFILKHVIEIVAEAGAELKIIYCTASPELRRKRLEERIASNSYLPFMMQTGTADIEDDLEYFSHLPPDRFIVDTAGSLVQCLEDVLRYIYPFTEELEYE